LKQRPLASNFYQMGKARIQCLAKRLLPLVAEQIIQRNDQWTLQRLELVDQATREGWRRSEQFSERLTALQEERPSIREELGDSNYDQYLFASGESNRVQISSIINGSAAQIAGMENGDVVISYANQRVFTSGELQRATREGSRGEPVQLEVLRFGEQINIELPRFKPVVTSFQHSASALQAV